MMLLPMRPSVRLWIAVSLLLAAGFVARPALAWFPQESAGASATDDELEWPRESEADGYKVTVYQPQLDDWKDHERLVGRCAVELAKGDADPYYGSVELIADTATNFQSRSVRIEQLSIGEVRFPSVEDGIAEDLEAAVRKLVPERGWEISLDRVLAGLERTEQQQREIDVSLDPPPIYRSESPAILVIFIGEPAFEPVKGTGLLFAVNTNWDVFLDPKRSAYYLLNEGSWLTAPDPMKGPWTAAKKLPGDLGRLPSDDNWADVRKNVPGVQPLAVPKVIATDRPAELIETDGPPSFVAIKGTQLLYASDTDSYLFLHSGEGKYYFLVAGRWFRSDGLDGPWSSAMKDLPEDFAKIPHDSPMGDVLASVPGTEDAELAVIQASIPRKATVDRKKASVSVAYDGDPEFIVVKDVPTVYYAVNTPYDVFRVDGRYYCCNGGIWFESSSASGPWVVATEIPAVLYQIPATHPKHNVTYVYVYDYDDDYVRVGYTSGYTGAYVASGVLLFGAGVWLGYELADDHHHHYYCYHYHSCWYSYGCGAHYNHYHGGYYRSARYYGPYGGAGRASWYNPHTGTYARGGYAYGPRGSAWAGEAYNPRTGTYASHRGVRTPYGSRGSTVVADGNKWARVGHKSTRRGTVVAGENSKGGKAVGGYNRRTGNSFGVAKDKNDNVYVGRDGNVYKRDSDGGWSSYNGGKWNNVNRASSADNARGGTFADRTGRTLPSQPRTASPRTGGRTSGSARASTGNVGHLDRQASRRSTGTRHTSRASTYRSHGSSRGGRTYRGGGGRSYGGGRGGGRGGRR